MINYWEVASLKKRSSIEKEVRVLLQNMVTPVTREMIVPAVGVFTPLQVATHLLSKQFHCLMPYNTAGPAYSLLSVARKRVPERESSGFVRQCLWILIARNRLKRITRTTTPREKDPTYWIVPTKREVAAHRYAMVT